MSGVAWNDAFSQLSRACAAGGIDLAAAGQVGVYNGAVAAEYRLPDFGDGLSLVVVLANSRALWPLFIAALKAKRVAPGVHPLDRYVEEVIRRAAHALGWCSEIRFAHEAPPRRVAMQQLARLTGLAALSPAHLSVHPEFGPWIGLRAAVVVDCPGPEGELRRSPCDSCEQPCLQALQRALDEGGDSERDWRRWVAIRDACSWGREYRYSEEQLGYHYTKDASRLHPCHDKQRNAADQKGEKQMSGDKQVRDFPPSQAKSLCELVQYGEGAVVSRTLRKSNAGTLTVFAFDVGQGLSEHSAPFDAYVQVLEGQAALIIGGERVEAKAGELVLMPADIPHAVEAPQRFKMLLTMIRDPRD